MDGQDKRTDRERQRSGNSEAHRTLLAMSWERSATMRDVGSQDQEETAARMACKRNADNSGRSRGAAGFPLIARPPSAGGRIDRRNQPRTSDYLLIGMSPLACDPHCLAPAFA